MFNYRYLRNTNKNIYPFNTIFNVNMISIINFKVNRYVLILATHKKLLINPKPKPKVKSTGLGDHYYLNHSKLSLSLSLSALSGIYIAIY